MNKRPINIDDLVRMAAPVGDEEIAIRSQGAGRQDLLMELLACPVPRGKKAARRGWPRRRMVVVLAGLFVVFSGATVLASMFRSETDPSSPWLSASEIPAAVDTLSEDIPLPPATDFDGFKEHYRSLPPEELAVVQATTVRQSLVMTAACMWLEEWRIALTVDDSQRERDAERVISEIPAWRFWSDHDIPAIRDHYTGLAEAVARGDRATVEYELGLNCGEWTTDVPAVDPQE